jgi:hypothetical protein
MPSRVRDSSFSFDLPAELGELSCADGSLHARSRDSDNFVNFEPVARLRDGR